MKHTIQKIFNDNVKGYKFCRSTSHCGAEGNWLEKKMGVKANCKNEPDLLGYEMKKQTRGRCTLGDWSGIYLFSKDISN